MRILVCNYRYFVSGGPERYMFKLMELLERHGHEIVPFSISYDRNIETPYSKYFVSPPVDGSYVYYSDARLGLGKKLCLFGRTLYNFEARRKIKEAIRAERIDLVYTLQVVNYLYPAVVDGAAEMGVPVVSRLSDFQLLCPAYHFFRKGAVCEDCREGLYNALAGRCLKGSLSVTGARVAAMYLHRLLGTARKVDFFVAPSAFLREKMVEFGYPADKVRYIPTFVDCGLHVPEYTPGGYVLYAGRAPEHKGVEVLIRAFGGLRGIPLKLVGVAPGAEEDGLRRLAEEEGVADVEFLGFRDKEALAGLYRGASFVVVPSIWYENTPNVILEAMAYGKPVLASDLGGMPELVKDGETGLTFRPGDAADLREKAVSLFSDRALIERMGRNARRLMEMEFSPEGHYESLMGLFEKALKGRGRRDLREAV